ncbi:MAG: imidazoleglycerol-phosphate dehydratase HisB [Clostridia bacterium]|nr:imidazoleglycerol-phosphate dehydratase HisB [Clostridia bacterium]
MNNRTSEITRNTSETNITLKLTVLEPNLKGGFYGTTGVGFMDHMMSALCVHGHFDIKLQMSGDLQVDDHHSIEDLGIVLGSAFAKAAGDRARLARFGQACIPMDESLSRCVLDISGRPYLVYNASFNYQYVGEVEGAMETTMFKEFFYAFAMNAGVTLHIENIYGDNDHHKIESMFKAFARALCMAARINDGDVLSTKGTLDA